MHCKLFVQLLLVSVCPTGLGRSRGLSTQTANEKIRKNIPLTIGNDVGLRPLCHDSVYCFCYQCLCSYCLVLLVMINKTFETIRLCMYIFGISLSLSQLYFWPCSDISSLLLCLPFSVVDLN